MTRRHADRESAKGKRAAALYDLQVAHPDVLERVEAVGLLR
jgi:hypothetical protein